MLLFSSSMKGMISHWISSGLTPSLLAYCLCKYVHVYTICNVACMFHYSFSVTFVFVCMNVNCVCLWAFNIEIRGKPSTSFETGPLIVHHSICAASWPVNILGLSHLHPIVETLGWQVYVQIYMALKVLNSGLHTCSASPHPQHHLPSPCLAYYSILQYLCNSTPCPFDLSSVVFNS